MAKLLLVSHNPLLTTGYGRVTSVLAGALAAAGHEVAVLGLGYAGEAHALPYRILPAALLGPSELSDAINRERPALLVTIGDPWMFEFLPRLEARRTVKWLAYFPLDGHPLPGAWGDWVRDVDVPVVSGRSISRWFGSEECVTAAGLINSAEVMLLLPVRVCVLP